MKIFAAALLVSGLAAGAWGASTWSDVWLRGEAAKVVSGLARVIDGDTIDVAGTRVRLEGIDAPETDQKCQDSAGRDYLCGISASTALRELVGRDPVTCVRIGRDSYGRVLGVCSNGSGVDLNAELVRRGLVVAFRRYSMRYADNEEVARLSRTGLWSGKFEHPGCYRSGKAGRQCRDELPAS